MVITTSPPSILPRVPPRRFWLYPKPWTPLQVKINFSPSGPRPHRMERKERMNLDPLIRRRIYNLLCIKSIVTLALTGLFVFLAVTGQVSARDFITIFSIVIAFYFGTQSQNPGDDVPPAGKT